MSQICFFLLFGVHVNKNRVLPSSTVLYLEYNIIQIQLLRLVYASWAIKPTDGLHNKICIGLGTANCGPVCCNLCWCDGDYMWLYWWRMFDPKRIFLLISVMEQNCSGEYSLVTIVYGFHGVVNMVWVTWCGWLDMDDMVLYVTLLMFSMKQAWWWHCLPTLTINNWLRTGFCDNNTYNDALHDHRGKQIK